MAVIDPAASRALRISAVIPVYRSALILPELHSRLTRALQAIADDFEEIGRAHV